MTRDIRQGKLESFDVIPTSEKLSEVSLGYQGKLLDLLGGLKLTCDLPLKIALVLLISIPTLPAGA